MAKITHLACSLLLVTIFLFSPYVGWACGVHCTCNVPDSTVVLCQNTDCDSNVTTYSQGTAWTSCFVWQGSSIQCCGINENTETPGPLCGGSTLRTKGHWSDKLSGKRLSPDADKAGAQ